MSEITFLGRHFNETDLEAGHSAPDDTPYWHKARLSLVEAALLSGIAIHELKRAVAEGRLRASWRAGYVVERCDLDQFRYG